MGPVLCGTDFSVLAEKTAELMQNLAHRLGVDFHRLHVGEAPDCPDVECLQGLPEVALADRARELGASLLSVGSLGRRGLPDWIWGSTAERLVRCSSVPTLMVRQPECLQTWLDGKRVLKVLLAVSQDGSVERAFQWLEGISKVAEVQPFAVEVSGGPHLNERWFVSKAERLHRFTGFPRERCRLEVAHWPIEDHLLRVAQQVDANLILLGTRQRSPLQRFWQSSISMAVLRQSHLNVACVPAGGP